MILRWRMSDSACYVLLGIRNEVKPLRLLCAVLCYISVDDATVLPTASFIKFMMAGE